MSEQTELGQSTQTARGAVLRPFRRLFARGLVAIIALTTPVFAVSYWLTVPDGPWLVVLITHLIGVIAAAVSVRVIFSTTITLNEHGVTTRRLFGRIALVRPADVESILLVQLYEGSALDTLPQLFVNGSSPRLLLRMRGQFWSLNDMERVAEALEAPITRPAESLTFAQLRRTSPGLLSWYERRPRRH